MSSPGNAVQVQAGLDTLSLAGANVLQKLMGAATADDVGPAAVIQIEQLGSMFNASGPFYEDQIHDALRRCHSRQLERIGIIVGWRKGDTCSLLAETAGGQAIALLILCLSNMTNTKSCGIIIHRLSKSLLPPARCTSAPRQLADVCKLVSGKVAKLDFPRMLALQATRIRRVYLDLGLDHPRNLVEELDWSCMVGLLEVLSSALQRTNHMLRVTGTFGQAYVTALMMIVCPEDCEVTVEGKILHQGQRNKVWIEILTKKDDLAVNDYVLVLRDQGSTISLIRPNQEVMLRTGEELKYRWIGSLSTRLELLLATQNAGCLTQADSLCIKQLFGTLVLQAVFKTKPWFTKPPSGGEAKCLALNTKLFSQALGRRPELIVRRLERLLGLETVLVPDGLTGDMIDTWEALSVRVSSVVQCSDCAFARKILAELRAERTCVSHHLDTITDCGHRLLWLTLAHIFRVAIVACFVDASPDAVMHLRTEWYAYGQDEQNVLLDTPGDRSRWNDRWLFAFSVDLDATQDLLWHSMAPDLSFIDRRRRLGVSNGSSVIVPKNLIRQSLQPNLEFGFDLLDGCFDLDGRLHSSLVDADVPSSESTLALGKGPLASIIAPSNSGRHEKLEIVAQEHHEGIMLSAVMHFPNSITEISLRWRLNMARQPLLSEPCPHKPSEPFNLVELGKIQSPAGPPIAFEGGVGQQLFPKDHTEGTPALKQSRLMFLMTGQDRQSQFLCCGDLINCGPVGSMTSGEYALVLRDCCLACAAQQCLQVSKTAYIMV